MESTLRHEVQDFTRACENLVGFAHQPGLTDIERDAVVLLTELGKKNARIQTLEEAVCGALLPKIDWVNNPGE
jgi:hypothetical protein